MKPEQLKKQIEMGVPCAKVKIEEYHIPEGGHRVRLTVGMPTGEYISESYPAPLDEIYLPNILFHLNHTYRMNLMSNIVFWMMMREVRVDYTKDGLKFTGVNEFVKKLRAFEGEPNETKN